MKPGEVPAMRMILDLSWSRVCLDICQGNLFYHFVCRIFIYFVI